ncbi:MAG: hypothetical protein H7A33_01025 [Deltaproteobacteria bacterium]|nr:hypothetical protein [Deltaproteobacteria bacterium]
MTQVNGLSGVGTVSGFVTSGGTDGMEQALAAGVVADYDSQIDIFTKEIESDTAQKAQISSTKSSVENTIAGLDKVAGGDSESGELDYYDASSLDSDTLNALADQLDAVGMDGQAFLDSLADGKFKVSDIDALLDGLDNKLSALNSKSELKMIRFQALMDARKQALMQLSNMMQSQNQTNMSIIQNMKG